MQRGVPYHCRDAVELLHRDLSYERGLMMDQLSIRGYWSRGFDDEGDGATRRADVGAEAKRDAELAAAAAGG